MTGASHALFSIGAYNVGDKKRVSQPAQNEVHTYLTNHSSEVGSGASYHSFTHFAVVDYGRDVGFDCHR